MKKGLKDDGFMYIFFSPTLIRIISPCRCIRLLQVRNDRCKYALVCIRSALPFCESVAKIVMAKKRESNSHACVIRLRTVTSTAVKKMRCERSSVLQFESHCESLKFRLFSYTNCELRHRDYMQSVAVDDFPENLQTIECNSDFFSNNEITRFNHSFKLS